MLGFVNGKSGYIDKQGNVVIAFKYAPSGSGSFSEGLAPVIESLAKGNYFSYIDREGNKIIDSKYTFARSFSEGLASVEINGKWGFINKQGREVIACKYDLVNSFSEDLASVNLNGNWYFIDKYGNMSNYTIGRNYDTDNKGTTYRFELYYKNGLARICSRNVVDIIAKGKWYFIDKQGNKVSSYNYDFVDDCCEGLRVVELNRKYGFISD